jgi:hypothetical protein
MIKRTIKQIVPERCETDLEIFLTFDLDWACDEVLADTIALVEDADAYATWFVTHGTPLLKRLRSNPRFELGIHPNFNNILMGKPEPCNGKNADETIEKLRAIVPEAKTVRSHSTTQSSLLLQLFLNKGLTHHCNNFIPHQSKIELFPWYQWNGLIAVPYFWEDDVAIVQEERLGEIERLTSRKGLKIFNFHPIHVFLNTERIERYEESRPYHRLPEKLLCFRNNETPGARTALKTLLDLKK